MKAIKGITIVLVFLLALVVLHSFLYPTHIRSEHRYHIKASAPDIFQLINDVRQWPLWMPWHFKDSMVVQTFRNNTSGIAAEMKWVDVNNSKQIGRAIIKESIPNKKVFVDLSVEEWNNVSIEWDITPDDSGAVVHSSMITSTRNPFKKVTRYFIKGWMLRDIKKGLKAINLALLQSGKSYGTIIDIFDFKGQEHPVRTAVIFDTLSKDELSKLRFEDFKDLRQTILNAGLIPKFIPYYRVTDTFPNQMYLVEMGLTIEDSIGYANNLSIRYYNKNAISANYIGPFHRMPIVADSLRKIGLSRGKEMEDKPFIAFHGTPLESGPYKGIRPISVTLYFKE